MIGKIFKFLGIGVVLLVLSLLAYRFFTLNTYPDFAKGVIPTETLSESYKAGTLKGKTWKLPTVADNTGDFFAYEPIYFEKEKTLIITIRYNDSFLEEQKFDGVGKDYPLFPSLYADGTKRVLPTTYEYGYAFSMYSYRRYVFENVDLSQYEHLYLDIHFDEDYVAVPYTTLEIYNNSRKMSDYRLTDNDRKELEK